MSRLRTALIISGLMLVAALVISLNARRGSGQKKATGLDQALSAAPSLRNPPGGFRIPLAIKGSDEESSSEAEGRSLAKFKELFDEAQPDSLGQTPEVDDFIAEMNSKDFPSALAFLEAKDSKIAENLRLRIVRRWAEKEPEIAASWVGAEVHGPTRAESMTQVALAWAGQSLGDAVGWARQLANPGERDTALLSIGMEATSSTPTEALAIALALPASQGREDLIARATSEWAGRAPEQAAGWADKIQSPELRERILAQVAATWADHEPVQAAEFTLKTLAPGRAQDDAVVSVVQRWAQKAPDQTAVWVASFPEGSLRDAAAENLIKLWTDQDAKKAGDWVASLQADGFRDLAKGFYANQIAQSSPRVAAQWVESIHDDVLRECGLESIGENWLASDLPAAREWIKSSALPQDAKARLLAQSFRSTAAMNQP